MSTPVGSFGFLHESGKGWLAAYFCHRSSTGAYPITLAVLYSNSLDSGTPLRDDIEFVEGVDVGGPTRVTVAIRQIKSLRGSWCIDVATKSSSEAAVSNWCDFTRLPFGELGPLIHKQLVDKGIVEPIATEKAPVARADLFNKIGIDTEFGEPLLSGNLDTSSIGAIAGLLPDLPDPSVWNGGPQMGGFVDRQNRIHMSPGHMPYTMGNMPPPMMGVPMGTPLNVPVGAPVDFQRGVPAPLTPPGLPHTLPGISATDPMMIILGQVLETQRLNQKMMSAMMKSKGKLGEDHDEMDLSEEEAGLFADMAGQKGHKSHNVAGRKLVANPEAYVAESQAAMMKQLGVLEGQPWSIRDYVSRIIFPAQTVAAQQNKTLIRFGHLIMHCLEDCRSNHRNGHKICEARLYQSLKMVEAISKNSMDWETAWGFLHCPAPEGLSASPDVLLASPEESAMLMKRKHEREQLKKFQSQKKRVFDPETNKWVDAPKTNGQQ